MRAIERTHYGHWILSGQAGIEHPRQLSEVCAQEAKELADLVAAVAKGTAGGDRGPHQEALAALAASRAAAANVRMRCGGCEACLATQGALRRCLVNRAAAAAAAGHSGAQVAVQCNFS